MAPHATDISTSESKAIPTKSVISNIQHVEHQGLGQPQNLSFVLKDIKSVAFEDRSIPVLQDPHDVLVHVAQTGICGSDVHYWQRGRIGPYILSGPMVLGHESSGVVAKVGTAVTHLKPGDKVAMEPGVPCRRCEFCRKGSYHLCRAMRFAATPPYDGTLAKYYVNASDFCYKLPTNMDLEEGAMVEPVAVAVAICRAAGIKAHQTVVVMGCGPIGILCQAVAKAWGAKTVVGVDVVEARLALAVKYGADATFSPPRATGDMDGIAHAEAVAATMKRELDLSDGADFVLECSGAEACVQLSACVAKPGATMVQAGMGKEVVSFPITTVCTQGLTLKGSIRYLPGSYEAAIALIGSGQLDVKGLITNRFSFERAEEAFELVHQGRSDVFKVMVQGVE